MGANTALKVFCTKAPLKLSKNFIFVDIVFLSLSNEYSWILKDQNKTDFFFIALHYKINSLFDELYFSTFSIFPQFYNIFMLDHI